MDPLAVLAYGAEQALPLTGTGTENTWTAWIAPIDFKNLSRDDQRLLFHI